MVKATESMVIGSGGLGTHMCILKSVLTSQLSVGVQNEVEAESKSGCVSQKTLFITQDVGGVADAS